MIAILQKLEIKPNKNNPNANCQIVLAIPNKIRQIPYSNKLIIAIFLLPYLVTTLPEKGIATNCPMGKIKTSTNYIPTTECDYLYSMYLSGANALVCRKKLLQLGGFNELFAPFYIEDVELSIRAWRKGWICYYEHNAICRHKTSTTIKTKESKNYVKAIYYRNKMFLHAIHLPNNKLWLWYIQLFTETLVQTLLGKFYFIKAFKMFFSVKKEMLVSKNKFEANNIIPTKHVINLIVKSLEDKGVKTF